MKASRPQKLPPGLTVDDMTGGDHIMQDLNFSLYRCGMLMPVSVKAIRRKPGLE